MWGLECRRRDDSWRSEVGRGLIIKNTRAERACKTRKGGVVLQWLDHVSVPTHAHCPVIIVTAATTIAVIIASLEKGKIVVVTRCAHNNL
jgi:hypothetical protein